MTDDEVARMTVELQATRSALQAARMELEAARGRNGQHGGVQLISVSEVEEPSEPGTGTGRCLLLMVIGALAAWQVYVTLQLKTLLG